MLEQAGYTVLSATTGTEAMKILRDAPVCLVLSDHMLRGRTGGFLAKQMKKIKRKVPIILYSGKPPESMRNVDGFINKDESMPRFLSLVGDFVKEVLAIERDSGTAVGAFLTRIFHTTFVLHLHL